LQPVPSPLFFANSCATAISRRIAHHLTLFSGIVMPEPVSKGVPLSQRQLEVILTRFEQGRVEHEAIAKEIGCSLSCIRQKGSIFKRFGTVTLPKCRVRGRPRLITQEAEEVRAHSCSRDFVPTIPRLRKL